MKRREALGSLCALGVAPLLAKRVSAASGAPSTAEKIVLRAPYFLSATNPTATADQREMEAAALQVMRMPMVMAAREAAGRRFKILAGRDIPAEALQGFDAKMEEWAYHYVLLAMNSDANHPKVLHHDYGPPHEWFDMKVPGGRGPGTGENIDNAYSVIPIDGRSRYELRGQRMNPSTGDCPIHVVGNLSMSMNITSLGLRDTRIDPDGSFVVTIGPEPANGRPNHLQTTADSRYVFIRDARVDWRQVPSALMVRRLDPPTAPAMTLEDKAALAVRFIIDDVPMNYWFRQMVAALEDNSLSTFEGSGFFGGQPSQKLGRGHFKLDDDEAFVFTMNAGGAPYHNVILHDYWLMSLDYWNRTSTLNNTQSVANADGTYTYVVSSRDPGVHNWLDTGGLHETLMMIRLQLLPRNPDGTYGGSPAMQGKLVKLKDLDGELPAGTKRVSAAERRQQLAERLAAFKLRFVV